MVGALANNSATKFLIEKKAAKMGLKVDFWLSMDKPIHESFDANLTSSTLLIKSADQLTSSSLEMSAYLEKWLNFRIQVHFLDEEIEFKPSDAPELLLKKNRELNSLLRSTIIKKSLAETKRNGVELGRPKGDILDNPRMLDNEKQIKKMLNDSRSISYISRKLKLNRNTLSKFIKAKKWKTHLA